MRTCLPESHSATSSWRRLTCFLPSRWTEDACSGPSSPDATARKWRRGVPPAAGRAFAILIGLFGLLTGQFMLLFIALFVYVGATQENAIVQGRALTSGVAVRDAMVTDFRTLPHGSTVRDAANLLLATSQHDFPVVLGEQVLGLLNRTALLRGMAEGGPDAYIAGIMDRNFPAPEFHG